MFTRWTVVFLLIVSLLGCKENQVQLEPPSKPLLLSPLNKDTLVAESIVFEWTHANSNSKGTQNDFYLYKTSMEEPYATDIVDNTIEISDLGSGSWYWKVIATNSAGSEESQQFSLFVINPEDVPSLIPPKVIESKKSEIVIESQISSTESISESGIVISRYSLPEITDRKLGYSSPTAIMTFTVDNLYDGQTYYLRSYAITRLGTIYSEEIKVVTWDDQELEGDFVDSRDDTPYSWKRIGSQKWMTQNLAYLPEISDPSSGSIDEPRYYVYNYYGQELAAAVTSTELETYGALYNWPAAIQDSNPNDFKPQGACPTGFHLPNDEEWEILIEYLGGRSEGGGKLKTVGFDHWEEPNTGATDEFGFSALPAGARGVSENPFQTLGTRTFWWSATDRDEQFANRKYLYNEFSSIGDYYQLKSVGFSVRCIKD